MTIQHQTSKEGKRGKELRNCHHTVCLHQQQLRKLTKHNDQKFAIDHVQVNDAEDRVRKELEQSSSACRILSPDPIPTTPVSTHADRAPPDSCGDCVGQVTSPQPDDNQEEVISTRREILSVVLETRNRAARLEQKYRDLKRKKRKQARKERKVVELLPLADIEPTSSSSTHETVLQRRGRMWYVV